MGKRGVKEQMPTFMKRFQPVLAVSLAILINLMDACVFGAILFPATFKDVTVRGVLRIDGACGLYVNHHSFHLALPYAFAKLTVFESLGCNLYLYRYSHETPHHGYSTLGRSLIALCPLFFD